MTFSVASVVTCRFWVMLESGVVGKVSLSTLSSERAFVPVTKDPVESSITPLACGSSDVFTLVSKLVDRSALSN